MGDHYIEYTPEEAISAIGFGKFQGIILGFAGLGWMSEAMELMLLSIIGVALQSEWSLSPGEESLLTSVLMAGTLVGNNLWGVISDAYGRRKGFTTAAIIMSVAGLCCAFSPNYKLLVIFRGLVGLGLAGGHVLGTWFLEFIPAPNRGAWAFVLVSFTPFGSIIEASFAWIIMPRWGWRYLIALSSLPSFLVLLLSGLMPESPRYLCVKGKMEEAHKILENIATINETLLPPGILVLDQTTKMDQEHLPLLEPSTLSLARENKCSSGTCLSSLFKLFSPKLRRTTLLLWLLYFANTFLYFGVMLLTSQLSNRQINCTSTSNFLKNAKDTSLYRDTFIASLADFPGVVISALIVDKLGRKLTMEVMCILSFILLLPLTVHQNEIVTTALLFGARMFISSTFSIVVVYSREVYPTSLRATGVGSASSIGKIGGMLCPLVAVGLVRDCHQTAAFVLFEAMIVLMGLSTVLLPLETSGKPLSDTIHICI